MRYWMQEAKVPLENVLIIVDEIALPLAKLRIKKKGSAGGHNGLKHIEQVLGTQDYPRLRFGIGNEFSKGQQVNYVLGQWDEDERATIAQILDAATACILQFTTIGIDRTMEFVNKRK